MHAQLDAEFPEDLTEEEGIIALHEDIAEVIVQSARHILLLIVALL